MMGIAIIPYVQVALHVVDDLSQATLPTLYLASIAMAITLGRNTSGTPVVCTLLVSLALAGLLSTGLAIAQWLQVEAGIWMIALAPGQRPMANLGQPNHLATLLLWALCALWWAWATRTVGAVTASIATAWLLAGLVLTQSRTGVLGLGLLAIWALACPATDARRPARAWVVAAAAGVVGLWLALQTLGAQTDLVQGARSSADTMSTGKRPAIWAMALDAISRSPWVGYGWGMGGRAHWLVLPDHPPLHVNVTYMHNVLLDVAVWSGVPVALALTGAAFVWAVRRVRRTRDALTWVLWGAVGVFTLHAMLEMPHAYVYFLIPAGLMIGAIDARTADTAVSARERPAMRWLVVPWAVVAACVVLLVAEYRAVQSDFVAYRFRAARIGDLTEPPPPATWLLSDLQRSLSGLRIEPHRGMADAELGALAQAVARHPGRGSLMRWAQALWLNDRPDAAAEALRRLCALNPPPMCHEAQASWQAWVAQGAGAGDVEPAPRP